MCILRVRDPAKLGRNQPAPCEGAASLLRPQPASAHPSLAAGPAAASRKSIAKTEDCQRLALGAVQGVDEIVGENHTRLKTACDGDPVVTSREELKECRRTPLTLQHPPAVYLRAHSPLSLEKPFLISRPAGMGRLVRGPGCHCAGQETSGDASFPGGWTQRNSQGPGRSRSRDPPPSVGP